MKRFCFVALLIFSLTSGYAQKYEWVQSFGGSSKVISNDNQIEEMVTDAAGNVYSVGRFEDTLVIAGREIVPDADLDGGVHGFIVKYNQQGGLLWVRVFSSNAYCAVRSIDIDTNKNVLTTGRFVGLVDFDPAINSNFLLGDTSGVAINTRSFVSKLDSNGNFVWAKSFNEDPFYTSTVHTVNFGSEIEINSNQDVIVTGAFGYKVDFDPGSDTNFLNQRGQIFGNGFFEDYLVCLSNDGDFNWVKQFNTYSNYINQDNLEVDSLNNIYFQGIFRDTLYFDGDTANSLLKPIGLQNFFLAKLDSTGKGIWAKGFGSRLNNNFGSISTNPRGETYFHGFFVDTIYYDNQPLGIPDSLTDGNFVLRISQDGSLTKSAIFSTNNNIVITDLTFSKTNKEVFATGGFSEEVAFFGQNGKFVFNAQSGRSGFVTKLDSNFKSEWVKTFGNPGDVFSRSIASDDFGNVITAGLFQDSVDFDPSSKVEQLTSNSWQDIYLHKLSPCAISRSSRTDTICGGDTLFYGQNAYTETGNYIDVFEAANGCDSLVTTQLYVIPQRIKRDFYAICQGESVEVEGQTYEQVGTYNKIIPSSTGGCDSTYAIIIEVDSTYLVNQEFTICENDSVLVANNSYKIAGTYTDSLQTIKGCDSVVISKVNVIPSKRVAQSVQICEGDSFLVGSSVYQIAGTFTDTVSSIQECDSIITTTLTVNPTLRTNVNAEICFGESFFFNDENYASSGNYVDTLEAVNGCDSVLSLNLLVESRIVKEQSVWLCRNESFQVGNNRYELAGSFADTLRAANGCDSIVRTEIKKSNLQLDTSAENEVMVKQSSASYQWLDCNDNFKPILDENNQRFSYISSGLYAVEVSKNDCVDTSECMQLNFENITAFSLNIYPNPSRTVVNMLLPNSGNLKIFDSNGRMVHNESHAAGLNQLQVQSFASGVYILRFEGTYSLIFEKLVIGQ